MAYFVTLKMELEVRDGSGAWAMGFPLRAWHWSPASPSGDTPDPSAFPPQAETIRIPASTSRTLTVPNGAKYVVILPGEFIALRLRNPADDETVIAMTPSSSPVPAPIMFPISQADTPEIVLANGSAAGAQNLRIFWL